MKKITIKIPDSAITASQTFSGLGFEEQPESVSERVRKWYIDPLRQMSGSQGFLVLMVLFPLYEKHLRNKHAMKGDFTEGHSIFRVVGGHLGIGEQDAFRFWSHFRNGLLHRASPKTSDQLEYAIRSDGKPIEKDGNLFWVNPFALRDRLLQEIEPDTRSWKTDEVGIPKTFRAN